MASDSKYESYLGVEMFKLHAIIKFNTYHRYDYLSHAFIKFNYIIISQSYLCVKQWRIILDEMRHMPLGPRPRGAHAEQREFMPTVQWCK